MTSALIFSARAALGVRSRAHRRSRGKTTLLGYPAAAASQLQPDIFSHILRCDFRKTGLAQGMRAKRELYHSEKKNPLIAYTFYLCHS